MEQKKRRIAIASGGTAGHVFPAKALADILGTRNEIIFFTDSRGGKFFDGEKTVLPVRNLQGNFIKKLLSLFFLGIATLKALYFLQKNKIVMAIGFGGIASFPVLYAAKLLNIPIVLHEQNAVLGKANKFFSKDVKLLATSFPHTLGLDEKNEYICTGNPIRNAVFEAKRRRTRITSEIFILITGGSQGAKLFDEIVAKAIIGLPEELQKKITIFQQVRQENIEAVKEFYKKSKVKKYELANFFKNIPQLMADSDLIITRAGASSLFEIEHLSIPAIIVPLASSTDNHQQHNAEQYALKGTSKIITEKELSPQGLTGVIENLFIKNEVEKLTPKTKYENTSAQKLAIKINEIIIKLRL